MQKRAVAALLSLVLLFSAMVPLYASAATKAELQDRIDQIDKEIADNKTKINELKGKQEKQQEYLDALQGQIDANRKKANALEEQVKAIDEEIDALDKKIRKLRNQMNELQSQIDELNEQITETRAEIEVSKEELSTKLRNSYINGNDSNLKILMGSSSLASFLTHLEMMKRMSENDKKMIERFQDIVRKLKEQRAELREKKLALREKKAAVQQTRSEKVERKNELRAKQAEYQKTINTLLKSHAKVNAVIEQLDRDSAAYQNYIKKLENEREAADREIDAIIRRAAEEAARKAAEEAAKQNAGQSGGNSSTPAPAPSDGGSWGYPVGGSTYVSSGYGNRSASISGWSFHGGIDIADPNGSGVIYGRTVYAARGGTVITATWGNTGYGNYVIIDHGDGYASLYGHCSTLLVSTGETVKKGQPIAKVGESGNARGAHLHFEIRKNGVKVNPSSYL